MPAAKRVTNWALILSPWREESGLQRAVAFGRMACRYAFQGRRFQPIYPLLNCLSYMTDEELDREFSKEVERWCRRVGRIWICLQPDDDKLDSVSHDVLLNNEGHLLSNRRGHLPQRVGMRIPVYRFYTQESNGQPALDLLERTSIDHILRCNITVGLFRGATAAAG